MSDTGYTSNVKFSQKNEKNSAIQSPIKGIDNKLLNFYKAQEPADKSLQFALDYEDAPLLLGGDRPLRRKEDSSKVIIRQTTTQGLYKVLISEKQGDLPKIKIMDETELFEKYIKGTVLKLSDDSYEITYFDENGDMTIEHYTKNETIKFMEEKGLIL